MNSDKKLSNLIIGDLIKKCVRQALKSSSSKKPEVQSHIIRI